MADRTGSNVSSSDSEALKDWSYVDQAVYCDDLRLLNYAVNKAIVGKEDLPIHAASAGPDGKLKHLHLKIRPPFKMSAPALGDQTFTCVTLTRD